MKKELTIDGKLYRLVEEKPELKVGDWRKSKKFDIYSLYNPENKLMVGFTDGKWSESTSTKKQAKSNHYKPANMEEVKKLLIKEAENRGFKEGVRYTSPNGFIKKTLLGTLKMDESDLVDSGSNIILKASTGKWAEIIEEKKPLYTNSYGTEFFEGDNYWYVSKNNARIYGPLNDSTKDYAATAVYSEMFKNKEQCLEWIESKLKK